MVAIDSTFDMLRDELHGLREDTRGEFRALREDNRQLFSALHQDIRDLRTDFSSLQGRLVQIGFALVGALFAAMVALIVALA